jgi:hypothetical protein
MFASSRAREAAFVSDSNEVTELMNFHREIWLWRQSARGSDLSMRWSIRLRIATARQVGEC